MSRGLDDDGMIAREGSLDRVPTTFIPVVDATRGYVVRTFGRTRLHSGYLYGSIPRGTAVPGVSDLDVFLVFAHEPTAADRSDADMIKAALESSLAQIDGISMGLSSIDVVLSNLERHDLGFFVACLCTPLIGPDLAGQLPRYRPTGLLARETNGDLDLVLPRWRAIAAEAITDTERKTLCRSVGRRLARTGFTLVMPRWAGWTSDLSESAEIFGRYYPQRHEQMRIAAAVGRVPSADPVVLAMLIEELGPWLAAEYTDVHGTKAPRP